jgi:hypothetical protein
MSVKSKLKLQWCIDCYVHHHESVKATQEVDDDPLCDPCAKLRARESIIQDTVTDA